MDPNDPNNIGPKPSALDSASTENPYLKLQPTTTPNVQKPNPKDNPYFALKGGADAVGSKLPDEPLTEYSKFLRIKQGQAQANSDYQKATSVGTYAKALVNPMTYFNGAFDLVKSLVTHPIDTIKAATGGLVNGVTMGGADAASAYVKANPEKFGLSQDTADSIDNVFHPDPTNYVLNGISSGFDIGGQAAPYMITDALLAKGLKYAAPEFVAKYGTLAKRITNIAGMNILGQTNEAFQGADTTQRLERSGFDTVAGVFSPEIEKVLGGAFKKVTGTIFKGGIQKTEPLVASAADAAEGAGSAAEGITDIKPPGDNGKIDLRKPADVPTGPKVRDINDPKMAVTVPESAVNPAADPKGKGTVRISTNDLDSLKNFIKGSSDINYKQVESLGKDAAGEKIVARHEFDPRTGMHTIYTTDATTASGLAHELGHYFDSKLTDETSKFSSMFGAAATKNSDKLDSTLASYAVEALGGNATGKEVSAKISAMTSDMMDEIDALSAARRGGTPAASMSERFADAVSQIITKDGADKAPTLSGFLQQANATKDATALFGRRVAGAVKAVAEQSAAIPKEVSSLASEARQYKTPEEFATAKGVEQASTKGLRPVEKTDLNLADGARLPRSVTIEGEFSKTTNSYGKVIAKAVKDLNPGEPITLAKEGAEGIKIPRADISVNADGKLVYTPGGVTSLEDLHVKATAGAEKIAAVEIKGEAPDLKRIPTGRQPATIPIKVGNVTKDVDAQKFIEEKILPKLTGSERIAKTDAEIINRAMSSDLTEKDFNDILSKRFGNLSEDVVKAKQFMTDGAKALSERLAGRSISELGGQEAKDLMAQYNRIVQTFEVFSGVRTELSNSFRSLGLAVNAGENDTLQEALSNIQKAIGDEKDPFQIAKKMVQAQKNGIVEKYFKIWYPSVLSGPKTQVRNILGNFGGMTMQTISTLFTTDGRAEFGARITGMIDSQKDALNYAFKVFKGEESIYSKFHEPNMPTARTFKGVNAFFDAVGGFMEGTDAYFSKTYQAGEVAALRKGAVTYGLENQGLIDGINDGFGKVNAQLATFRNPVENTALGTVNKGLQALKRSDSGLVSAVTRFLVPFSNTITNITDRAIDFTPVLNLARTFGNPELYESRAERILSEAGFSEKIAADATAKGLSASEIKGYIGDETARVKSILVDRLRSQQMGRFYTGIAATGLVLPLAITGRITGNGPADANQKALLMQTGWRPNSIILPDGTALPYNELFSPLGMVLSIAGNVHDSITYKTDKTDFTTKVMDGFVGFMRSEVDQSFLSGIASLFDVISGNQSPTAYINSFAASAIPIPAAWTQVKDIVFPERYNATAFNEQIRNKLGITGDVFGLPALTPKVDALGNPVKADLIYGTLPPIGNEDYNDDPVYQFMAENDAFVGKPSSALIIKGSQKGQERGMTTEEYTQYVTDSGKEIYAKLKSEIDAGYFNKFTTKAEIKNAIDGIAQPIRTKYKNKIRY